MARTGSSATVNYKCKWMAIGLGVMSIAQLGGTGCAKSKKDAVTASECVSPITDKDTGGTGSAFVFDPDPMAKIGSRLLSPASPKLDDLRSQQDLSHLGGRGVLEGTYVDTRTSHGCVEGFGAVSSNNQFLYSQRDPRFQEAMSYRFGDIFRSKLDEAQVLASPAPVEVIAHCMPEDNAFYVRGHDRSGQKIEKVCLGDSQVSPGASYADDASVVVHELQHATTVNAYDSRTELNQFWYDEAGALNEAISDFSALSFFAPSTPDTLDARLFSRWALGAFIPEHDGTRGAHRCPAYDPRYPGCLKSTDLNGDNSAFDGRISYVYPDGLGWPYGKNYTSLSQAFTFYRSQEEIHNAGIVMVGALWDVYDALRIKSGDADLAFKKTQKIIYAALRALPKPTLYEQSPVTFRGFAEKMVLAAGSDSDVVIPALRDRGLYNTATLASGWAARNTDSTAYPDLGVKIMDDPHDLKKWIYHMSSGTDDGSIVKQTSSSVNNKLDSGEVAAIWFDIKDLDHLTAGGLSITVTSKNPELVQLMDNNYNIGAISSTSALIRYNKVNGTDIVKSLTTSQDPSKLMTVALKVPTSNTYFKSNPYFSDRWTSAIWVIVNPNLPAQQTAVFQLQIRASNASSGTPTETVDFPVMVN